MSEIDYHIPIGKSVKIPVKLLAAVQKYNDKNDMKMSETVTDALMYLLVRDGHNIKDLV